MKSLIRNALLGAAGLVALSLTAHAAGSTSVADTPLAKSSTSTTHPMKMAQRPYDPSAGSVGFRNEIPAASASRRRRRKRRRGRSKRSACRACHGRSGQRLRVLLASVLLAPRGASSVAGGTRKCRR